MSRGFFAIGIERSKYGCNVGTLWRSAYLYGAKFIFTIGLRYKWKADVGAGDTVRAWKHIPLFHFDSPDDMTAHIPRGAPLVGVELDDRAVPVHRFSHPRAAVYILGAEDHGLTRDMTERCHHLVRLPGSYSMNVACAGTVVMQDRWVKQQGCEVVAAE